MVADDRRHSNTRGGRDNPDVTHTGTSWTEQSTELQHAPKNQDIHADPGEGRVGRGKHGTEDDGTAVVGMFKSQAQAEHAVHALRDSGIDQAKISIIAHDKHGGDAGRGAEIGNDRDDDLALMFSSPVVTSGSGLEANNYGAGFWTPAAVGGVAGMLTSSGMMVIPGIGQIFAAGPLTGVVTGGVSGSIANGLLDLGIPDERSRYIESKVREGHILAVVHTNNQHVADKAMAVMRQNGADDVETHERKGARSTH